MQFTTTVIALFAAVAAALPAEIETRQVPYAPCAGLTGTAQCCATDVLGVADLDCQNPSAVPANATDYQQLCADVGQRARCCLLPILGQALVCQTPVGVVEK